MAAEHAGEREAAIINGVSIFRQDKSAEAVGDT